ncbi:MAG: ATP-binding protein, partial [Bacteroidota bacterium]
DEAVSVPMFHAFAERKKELAEQATEDMRLEEFKPRVLSSFVRNRLIDTVYFPLIGANLAKQIGTSGEGKRTDLMGLLLLISPPGYGKTTLMEYLASRLGIVFMKINGPAIGHEVTSVDPADAPNSSSAEELEKLNLSFEMGDNVMIYLDDIQHLNPEFLQKFISLCDAQRRIEGVYKGRTKTYDFRGKKVAVVMAGNPYTESGDKFQIPDMLANRADIYNLGDIIGDSDDAFKLSYLENCLTANSVLNKLGGKSHKDVLTLIRVAETGVVEGQEYEANHSPEEISEYVNLFQKLLRIRDVVLTVNQTYIDSAGMQDEYRTEPPFKLQGSYRDMNKMAEKVSPIMNEAELETVIRSHYEQEAQTLTSGAEANLLKLKQLIGTLTEVEEARWQEILEVFAKQQRAKGYGGSQVGLVVEQLERIAEGLSR